MKKPKKNTSIGVPPAKITANRKPVKRIIKIAEVDKKKGQR